MCNGAKMILDDIIAKTKDRVTEQKKKMSLDYLERAMSSGYEPRDALEALRGSMNIIAEIKKSSPSRGLIRADFHPLEIATEYEQNGASAISVLTEPYYFSGDIEYLGLIRRFNSTILLRKDFLIDPYQIARSRLYGADIVLLIVRILGKEKLKEMLDYARSIKLFALVEVHSEAELEMALYAGAQIIGINHRNLDTLAMDMSLSTRLVPEIPQDKVIVAESGLKTHEQLKELSALGVNAFLIGEHFMKQTSPGAALKEIKYGK